MKLGRSEIASLLLAAVAVGSAGLVWATRDAPTTAETSERKNHLFPLFRKDEIAKFSWENAAERIALERSGDDWHIVAPASEPADDAAVDRLLDGLGFATVSRRVTGQDRRALGLEKPRARLVLGFRERSVTLSLGAEAPAPAGAAYVEVDDGKGARTLAVVSREVAALLLVPTGEFRRHALVSFGPRELAELSIERPDAPLRLVRGKGVAFLLDGRVRADRDRAEPVLGAIAGLTATHFLDPALAKRTQPGALVVRLVPRDSSKKTEVLAIGGDCPERPGETLVVVREPALRAACAKSESVAAFAVEPASLVTALPFAARKDEVETFALERGGKSLVLTRRGNGFRLQKPTEADVDLEPGNQRLEAVLRAPAELVPNPDLKALGLAPPAGRAVLTVIGDDDKASEEVLELGAPQANGTLYARRAEDGVVLAIARDGARAFEIDSTLLRSRKILDFALSALTELEVEGPVHQLLKRAPSGFELSLPRGFPYDGELATEAVLALGSLTAQRYVADQDDGSFGFEKPTLSARFRTDADAGPSENKLVVGRRAPGGYFAKLTSDPGVFSIERGVVDRLETLFIDRGAFLLDPATVARVTLAAGQKRFVIERRAGELLAAAGHDAEPTAVAAAIEALSSLRAEAALHTGPPRPNEGLSEPALTVTIEPSAGHGAPRVFRIGSGDNYEDRSVRYGRAGSIDATYVIADSKLRPLFDLL